MYSDRELIRFATHKARLSKDLLTFLREIFLGVGTPDQIANQS